MTLVLVAYLVTEWVDHLEKKEQADQPKTEPPPPMMGLMAQIEKDLYRGQRPKQTHKARKNTVPKKGRSKKKVVKSSK
jgi:hypothetical protein